MPDLRFLAGPAMIITGGSLLVLAWRLWFVHPINRVFKIGPFVTEEGIKAVVNLRMTILALGSAPFVQGLSSTAFWFGRRDVFDPIVEYIGALGACLFVWAAFMAARGVWRLWRTR